jgi:hypothetical protein
MHAISYAICQETDAEKVGMWELTQKPYGNYFTGSAPASPHVHYSMAR